MNIGEAKGQVDAGETVPKAVMAEKRIPTPPTPQP